MCAPACVRVFVRVWVRTRACAFCLCHPQGYTLTPSNGRGIELFRMDPSSLMDSLLLCPPTLLPLTSLLKLKTMTMHNRDLCCRCHLHREHADSVACECGCGPAVAAEAALLQANAGNPVSAMDIQSAKAILSSIEHMPVCRNISSLACSCIQSSMPMKWWNRGSVAAVHSAAGFKMLKHPLALSSGILKICKLYVGRVYVHSEAPVSMQRSSEPVLCCLQAQYLNLNQLGSMLHHALIPAFL